MPFKFRLRPIPLLATVLVTAVGIMLGNWQTRRGDQKEALQAQLEARGRMAPLVYGSATAGPDLIPEEAEYRRVRLRGRYLDWPVYLDNRPYQGRPGFYVLMPMELNHSSRVAWVARGWVARDVRDRSKVPAYPVPRGEVAVEGLAVRSMSSVLQLGQAPKLAPGAIVQNAALPQLEGALQRQALPFFVRQTGEPEGALVRDWPAPALGVDKHRGYAFQWYGLSLMAVIFFIVTGFRRGGQREQEHAKD